MQTFKNLLRASVFALVLLYFVAAATMLAIRYWALPRIDDWRPLIEQHLSEGLGTKVSIAALSADWSGLNPTLTVRGLELIDTNGDVLISLPSAFAIVSWRSVLEMDIRLKRLDIQGIDLAGSRHPDGSVSIAGQRFAPEPDQSFKLTPDTLALRWLLEQGEVFVRQASFRWNDQFRQAPVLNITEIDASLTNSLFGHEFRLIAAFPEAVAKRIELVVKTENFFRQLSTHSEREAELFIEVQDLQLAGLAPWVDVGASGSLAGRAWIDVQGGQLGQTTIEVWTKKIAVPFAVNHSSAAFAQTAQFRATGWFADVVSDDFSGLLARSGSQHGVSVSATTTGFTLDSALFSPSLLELGDVTARARIFRSPAGLLGMEVAQIDVQSNDLAARLQGSWTGGSPGGVGQVDVTGLISKMPVAKLHQYVSLASPPEARTFLRTAITGGQLLQTSVALKGDLAQFPFNHPETSGVFKLAGQFDSLAVDYDPVRAGQANWPMLIEGRGKVVFDKLSLQVSEATGALVDPSGARLAVRRLDLSIPDLELDPQLSIDALIEGDARSYVTILRQGHLPEPAKASLERVQLSGQLTVPLTISQRLNSDQPPRVNATINLAGAGLSLGKEYPSLENIRGVIELNDQTVRTEGLRLQFLGGETVLRGGWGPGITGAQAEGTLTVAALTEFAGKKALVPAKGQSRYKLQLSPTKENGYEAVLTSTLEGIALTLPEPLGKAAESRLPLTMRWVASPVKSDLRHALSFSLGELINGRFERLASSRPSPFFPRAAISMGSVLPLPASGLALDLAVGKVDWDDWSDLVDEVVREPKLKPKGELKVMPSLRSARLRSSQLVASDLTFTNLEVLLQQPETDQWAVRVNSQETEGSLNWRAASGALDGRITAKFSRAALGAEDTGQPEALKIDVIEKSNWEDIPAIDLTIDDFTLYGSRLGSFRLIGSNQQRKELWTIEKLEIQNPAATAKATGQWRLKGPARGVKLDAEVEVSDFGKLSERMGHPDRVRDGSGKISAQIDWINFPWVYSHQGLNGSAKIDFKQGVFEHVNSRSARLLELLSLQSLQRLLSFNFRPGDEFKNGFPWNSLSGAFAIKNGVVETSDLTINSPVASILLIGKSDLDKKLWDMEADVRPLFDMSGAALATAFVVNPVAGLSALVTQFLLRHPLEKAMTVRYAVTGPWDEPVLKSIGVPEPAKPPKHSPLSPGN